MPWTGTQVCPWPCLFLCQCLEALYYLGSEQQRCWSDCPDTQADCAFVARIWHKTSFLMTWLIFELHHDKTNKMTCAPAKTQISLSIRTVWSVFAVQMKAWVLSYIAKSLISEDVQADLSLRRAHMTFCWFCCAAAHFRYEPRHEKTCLCHLRTAKVQISLCIHTVWSAPLLFVA